MIIICTIWIKKRDYFPIKERSPWTLILFCISNFFYILAYPAAFLLVKGDVNIENLIYLFFLLRMLAFWPYIVR